MNILKTPLNLSLFFLLLSTVLLFFADIEIVTNDPFLELLRFTRGFLSPDFLDLKTIFDALLKTLSFAFLGVLLGVLLGAILSLFFHNFFIRAFCAFIRAVHEIFWAIIFLQIFGLSVVTGIIAIAIPYSGTFAKVYSEIFDEGDKRALYTLLSSKESISHFIYIKIPQNIKALKSYTFYRFECGIRSSAVLGFIGMPTIGYHLETFFMDGDYSKSAGLLILFYLLIFFIKKWANFYILFIVFISSLTLFMDMPEFKITNLIRFLTIDIVPLPILKGYDFTQVLHWFLDLFEKELFFSLFNTFILSFIALVLSGIVALLLFPLISNKFVNIFEGIFGNLFLVILRSTPEYIFTFIILLLLGPSMLPAIIALGLHNGAIIAHLIGNFSENIKLRTDTTTNKINLYFYEILPRVYGQFLAFLLYRWEIIIRESAILGILGVYTLGFFVDSAIEEIRFDKAIILICFSAVLNIFVDILARFLRRNLHLNQNIMCQS